MDPTVLTYILLGAVALLLIGVIVLLISVIRLRNSVRRGTRKNAQSAEYMQQSIRQDIQNVQDNVRGLQSTMAQTMTQSYASLNQTLDNKLQGSFDSINSYLQDMNKDLGEMKSVASGIEDVKKVLTNVKSRGILGEIQLGSILQDILPPSQYETNIATVPGSSERVEYAVRLPGDEIPVYLPIDSKFPGDAYSHLLDAYDAAAEAEVKATRSILLNQFRKEARDISSKYIKVPYTTEFAVMFLPFEGLYAEAVNLGAIEMLQREYNVVIAGPSTMAALLNSLQMGFKTLAIQENAERVWQVLGNVKSEFAKFAEVLDDTQDRLMKVNEDLDKLIGVRTKKIQRALLEVEDLDNI
ncbi:MAG: DNA recombination protein RmuC [Firmicutes bacterium]|nr:DNA recombination protein RmuC [Bacillota bacterium]MBR0481869.1 DNA recombination protein RmuC [Bacillota bacterium]